MSVSGDAVAPFKLTLMGDLRIEAPNGESLALKTKKGEGVIAHLALCHDRSATRERLAGLFWGDTDQSRARQSLRQTLFQLTRQLRNVGADILAVTEREVLLRTERLWVDVWAFEEALARHEENPTGEVLQLYHGDLLESLYLQSPDFDNWLAAERQRLQQAAMSAAEALMEGFSEDDDPRAAIAAARAALRIDPYREDITRRLMRLYLASSKRTAAINEYRKSRDLLLSDLGIGPEVENQRLYEEIVGDSVQPRSGSAIEVEGPSQGLGFDPGRLGDAPAATQGFEARSGQVFVGRRAELGLIIERHAAVAARGALGVLLTGEAGIGKSHLIETAAMQLADGAAIRLDFSRGKDDAQLLIRTLRRNLEAANDAATLTHLDSQERDLLLACETSLADGQEASADLATRSGRALARLIGRGWESGTALVICDRIERTSEFGAIVVEQLTRGDSRLFVCGLLSDEGLNGNRELSAMVRRLKDDPRWVHVELPSLNEAEQRDLMRALRFSMDAPVLTARRRRWLESIADGNPGVLIAGLLELTEAAENDPGREFALPEAVAGQIAKTLNSLSEGQRRWLQAAAIAGDGAEVRWVDRCVGLGPKLSLACSKALSLAGLILFEGSTFRFRNVRTKLYVAQQLLPQEEVAWHADLCAAIVALSPLPEVHAAVLANHAKQAARPLDALRFELLSARCDLRRGLLGKSEAAAGRLAKDLAARRGAHGRDREGSLLEFECGLLQCDIIERQHRWHDIADRLTLLEQEASLTALPEHGAKVAVCWARHHARQGDGESANYLATRAFLLHEQAAEAAAWRPADGLLPHFWSDERPAGQNGRLESLEARRYVIREAHLEEDDLDCTTRIAALHLVGGAANLAAREAGQARRLADRTGDDRYRALALQLLAMSHYESRTFDRGEKLFDEAFPIARTSGDVFRLYKLHAARGLCRLRAGAAAGAVSDGEAALGIGGSLGCRRLLTACAMTLAAARTELGDRAGALVEWRRACAEAAARNDLSGWQRARDKALTLISGQGWETPEPINS